MIDQSRITREWIDDIAGIYKADPILTEKVIRALLLLEGLVKQDLPFVFKGGTALMLHFDSAKRLSIDIDIILPDKKVDLSDILTAIVKQQGFTHFELQNRNAKSDIEKAHFKLFYKPARISGGDEEYVLLDILFEEVYYTQLSQLPIQSSFVPQEGEPVNVNIPTKEDLLGDKLTAFAPNTTGIPYFKGEDSMSMEIIKQLYDIGTLFDEIENLQVVSKTFKKFAVAELAYRDKSKLQPNNILEDIYQTSLAICTRGKDGDANFEELQKGISRIRSFIFSEKYHLEKAISHATKAAYLATLLKEEVAVIERFETGIDMKDWVITQPMNTRVNKLKKTDPEAFFYWFKIFKLAPKSQTDS